MDTIDFNKVGLKMKELRTAAGISQQTVANDIGTTIAFVSNIENNKVKINLRMVIYYAELCKVPVDVILDAGRLKKHFSADESLDQQIFQTISTFSLPEKQKLLQILQIINA